MTHYALVVLCTVLGWWSMTGLILVLDGRPTRTFPATLVGATIVLGAALWGIAASSQATTAGGVYVAFASGLLVWGWVEISFLMGFLTGPRRRACPSGCAGLRHFRHAVEAILYHEAVIIAGAIALVALTYGKPNQFGVFAYLLLWAMRTSAKLNLFLGVPNLGEKFLPAHLKYLQSFFRKQPMNLLFPVSVTVPTVLLVALVERAAAPGIPEAEVAGYALLATLLGLGILEHWFLVVPLPSEALWRFGLHEDPAGADVDPWSAALGVRRPSDFAPEPPRAEPGVARALEEGGVHRAQPRLEPPYLRY